MRGVGTWRILEREKSCKNQGMLVGRREPTTSIYQPRGDRQYPKSFLAEFLVHAARVFAFDGPEDSLLAIAFIRRRQCDDAFGRALGDQKTFGSLRIAPLDDDQQAPPVKIERNLVALDVTIQFTSLG